MIQRNILLAVVIACAVALPFQTQAWLPFVYNHHPAHEEMPLSSTRTGFLNTQPRLDESTRVNYSLRNGNNLVEGAHVRLWHLPQCHSLPAPPWAPPVWDFLGSTMLADIPLPPLEPGEVVTGTIAFAVSAENGFVEGLGVGDDIADNCNNVVFDFFSPGNALGIEAPAGPNAWYNVQPAGEPLPDYHVQSVFVNGVDPHMMPVQVEKVEPVVVKAFIENLGAAAGPDVPFDGAFQVCFSPRNAVPVSLRRGFCEQVDPIAPGDVAVVSFEFVPGEAEFSMWHGDADNMFIIGGANTAAIDVNVHQWSPENKYLNNEHRFPIIVNEGV